MNSLQMARDNVALEMMGGQALEGIVARAIPAIQNGIGNLIDMLKGVSKEQNYIIRNTERVEFLEKISQEQYLALAPVKIPVPTGLQSTYMEYLGAFDRAVELSEQIHGFLNDFKKLVAIHLTQKSSHMETKTNLAAYYKLSSTLDDISAQLTRHVDCDSTTSVAAYSSVVQRNSDWADVFKTHAALCDRMNRVSTVEMEKSVSEADDLLRKLVSRAEAGEFATASNEFIMELSEGSLMMGRLVEFFSVVTYMLMSLSKAIDDDITVLTKIMEPA